MRAKPIDADFFRRYAGSRRPYAEVFRDHSYIDECIELFRADDAPRVRSLCVLGSGTGLALKLFERAFKVKPFGCEISEWAHVQTPQRYRARIKFTDMVDYVKKAEAQKRVFDLTFSNSLIYLDRRDIPRFLKRLARVTRYFHFRSSFKGDSCPDPYRRTLESYEWWNRALKRAGFRELTTTFGEKTYLWKSEAR